MVAQLWTSVIDLETALPDPDLYLGRTSWIRREFTLGHATNEQRHSQKYGRKGVCENPGP